MSNLDRSIKAKETLETFIAEVEKIDKVAKIDEISAIELKCQAAAQLAFEQVSHILEDMHKTATAKRTELRNAGYTNPADKARAILNNSEAQETTSVEVEDEVKATAKKVAKVVKKAKK